MTSELKEFLKLLGDSKEYLLSHHPSCDKFQNDCYHLGEKRLCVGCFTAYPIALAIIALWFLGVIDISILMMFIIGLFFGSLQFLSLTGISDIKLGKVIIKIFLGVGIGFYTTAIFSLPIYWLLRLVIFILLINVAALFSFLRMRKINRICEECEYEKNWSRCPGFEFPEGEEPVKGEDINEQN